MRKDLVGNALAVGDTVAFDVLSYRSSSLRCGEIKKITEGTFGSHYATIGYQLHGKNRTITRLTTTVIKAIKEL
ncbi:hypothetical protein ABIE64_002636 [Thalassospira sp. MBR-102]|uniref:hypothetical protein n=1 Tax=Thalassospira sp. MBR-102 TaxID=3156466 RepID=UPI00339966A7